MLNINSEHIYPQQLSFYRNFSLITRETARNLHNNFTNNGHAQQQYPKHLLHDQIFFDTFHMSMFSDHAN